MADDENKKSAEVRFAFGSNWTEFLRKLNDERIQEAEKSIQDKLKLESLAGLIFVDAGSGSGLFSLAAKRLGAAVHSFDYDIQSVECTRELKRRFFADDEQWIIQQGSVLDSDFLASLPRADVVYSWGVLHHTGAMWQALENVTALVKDDGFLFISIYNDQGLESRFWTWIKKRYNQSPFFIRWAFLGIAWIRYWFPALIHDLRRGRLFPSWYEYTKERGMSPWHDLVDWVGGYPFEVAMPHEIVNFYIERGFNLIHLHTLCGGSGCNEYVFKKTPAR
ncbi:MAG: methyltransferase domain-containing protein [bacterium]|nr:methyltransferase domain-containing protein [bacterium]